MPGICPLCGKSNGRNKKTCSMTCYANLKQNYKQCIVCGKSFKDSASNTTVTCSPECSLTNRKNLAEKGKFSAGLEKAHIAAVLWLRNHSDLIDGTVKQAFDGISKIKYSIQGKRKNPSYQWKGWTLQDFEQ